MCIRDRLAYHLEQESRSYVVLERSNVAGSFFQEFPRHRKLISINKVYTGQDDPEVDLRWDWNSILSKDPSCRLGRYTKEYFPNADHLVDHLNDYAEQFQLNIEYNKEVSNIQKIDGKFIVSTSDGENCLGKVVVVATGIFKPYIPEIPGIELCENYVNCSVDPEDYCNERVLIVGKGNSGFETADNLVGTASLIHIASPNSVKMAWQTHFVGHLRAVNNNFLDTYQLKSQNAVIDAEILNIEKIEDQFSVTYKYAHANGEIESILYDKVIISTGFRFDTSLFAKSIQPELMYNDRFPSQTHEWESVNVSDLYFAGAITQQRDFKKTTSAFIHGFRYNVECLFHILEKKYQKVSLPSSIIEASSENFTDKFIDRINKTSSLWQQFGFLCDMISLDIETGKAVYFETVPKDYIMAQEEWNDKHLFLLSLEYGDINMNEDILATNRIRRDEIDVSNESKFLHPIVRHYHQGEMISEFHMIEVLEARWTDELLHIRPLFDFIQKEMNQIKTGELAN